MQEHKLIAVSLFGNCVGTRMRSRWKKKNPRKTKTSVSKPVSLLINEKPDFAVKDLMQSDYEHIPP